MKKIMVMCIILNTLVLSLTASAKVSTDAGLSMIRTGGNTQLETYNLKSKTTKEWEKRSTTLGAHYTLGTAVENNNKTESARNWDASLKYEEVLSKRLNGVVSYQIEGNKFAGYDQRDNVDIGGKYKIINTDMTKFFTEVGLRYTVERATSRNSDNEDLFKDTKGILYAEYSHLLSKTVNYKFWIQYLPNFTRSDDYQINFEPSLNVTLSDMFSLSVAYTGRYDNQLNQGVEERLDWVHTTTLIAKF